MLTQTVTCEPKNNFISSKIRHILRALDPENILPSEWTAAACAHLYSTVAHLNANKLPWIWMWRKRAHKYIGTYRNPPKNEHSHRRIRCDDGPARQRGTCAAHLSQCAVSRHVNIGWLRLHTGRRNADQLEAAERLTNAFRLRLKWTIDGFLNDFFFAFVSSTNRHTPNRTTTCWTLTEIIGLLNFLKKNQGVFRPFKSLSVICAPIPQMTVWKMWKSFVKWWNAEWSENAVVNNRKPFVPIEKKQKRETVVFKPSQSTLAYAVEHSFTQNAQNRNAHCVRYN